MMNIALCKRGLKKAFNNYLKAALLLFGHHLAHTFVLFTSYSFDQTHPILVFPIHFWLFFPAKALDIANACQFVFASLLKLLLPGFQQHVLDMVTDSLILPAQHVSNLPPQTPLSAGFSA